MIKMPNFLHEFCLLQLDHPLNQALVCGKRWPNGATKELITNYNLIHLFVVSGAHALFFEKGLKQIGVKKFGQFFCLGIYVLCCNFSSPISRCFIERILGLTPGCMHIYLPPQILKILSGILCLPVSVMQGEVLSLLLSLYFSLVVSSISGSKGFEFKVMLISMPVYIAVLGTPPLSALLVLILATPVIGTILLPLSFLSLASDNVEWFSHFIWWFSLDTLHFIEVFFNFPKKEVSDFNNSGWVLFHLISLFSFTHIGLITWRRKLFFT